MRIVEITVPTKARSIFSGATQPRLPTFGRGSRFRRVSVIPAHKLHLMSHMVVIFTLRSTALLSECPVL